MGRSKKIKISTLTTSSTNNIDEDNLLNINKDNDDNLACQNNKSLEINDDITIPLEESDNSENIVLEISNSVQSDYVDDSQQLLNIDENIIPSIIFIVPYRNRQRQYEFFSNHMKKILEDYDPITYKILYIHQQDSREFNRGAIKNIGFLHVKKMYPNDYSNITLVFNDIDTMPYTKNFIDYKTTSGIIKHFYGFKFTLGGIVSITAGDFEVINGFPNFWAWGYEDNMLQARALNAGFTIDRRQFYPIYDPNILHFPEGIIRNVNRTEFDVYNSNTKEGINSIQNISSQYDENTGFVHINWFDTNRIVNINQTFAYDLRNGAQPFKPRKKRSGIIKMQL